MQCLQVVCLIVVITLSAAAAALPPYLDLTVCLQPPNILPPWQESLLKSSKTPKSSWFSAWNLLWGYIPSICHQIWLWSFSKTPVGVNWVQQSGAISKKNWIGSPFQLWRGSNEQRPSAHLVVTFLHSELGSRLQTSSGTSSVFSTRNSWH